MEALKNKAKLIIILIVSFSWVLNAQDCLIHTKIEYNSKQKITTTVKDNGGTSTTIVASPNPHINWEATQVGFGNIINNQFIVELEGGLSAAQKIVLRNKYKAVLIEKVEFPTLGVELELWSCDFSSIPGISLETKKTTVASDTDIEGVDFNYVTRPGLESIGLLGNSPAILGDPSEIRIALIDIGIDETHSTLRDNISNQIGYDFINQDISPNDVSSVHGTHMASNILQHCDYKSSLINIKAFENGSNKNSLFYVTSATYFAICHGAKVINMSWGWTGSPAKCLEDAIALAGSHNCALVVCSAGNESLNLDFDSHYPSDYNLDNVISVAALGKTGSYAPYSNFGSDVDVAVVGEFMGALPKDKYGIMIGTSVSTASVSGVAGLLYVNTTKASYLDIKNLILSYSTPIPNCPYSTGCNIGLELSPGNINSLLGISLPKTCEKNSANVVKRLNTSNKGHRFSYFNNTMEISFDMESDSNMELIVTDVSGRVLHKKSDFLEIGNHQESISFDQQPPGIYFMALLINGERIVKKLIR